MTTRVATDDNYHRVYKNSAILTLLRLFEPLLSMVVIIAVSRMMSLETMGGYAFIISFVGMFITIGQMGLQTLVTREVAGDRDKSSSYLSGALLLGLGSSVILGVAMNLSKGYFGISPQVGFAVFLISLNLFPMFVISAFEAVFMGFERTDLIAYQQVLGNVTRVVLSLLFIVMGLGLAALVVAIVVSTVFAAAVSVYTYFKYLAKGGFTLDMKVCFHLLRTSPTFLSITLVWILWARLDVLFLTKLSTITQVAVYAAAYKLFEATMIVPQSYVRASFPHLSGLFRSSQQLFHATNRDMLRDVLFYAVPLAAIVVGMSPFIITTLYGHKFASSALILQVLMIGLIPWTAGRIFANTLVATSLQKYDLLAGVSAVPVSVVLNIWLIPRLGGLGAAIASAASLSAFFLSQMYLIKRAGYSVALWQAAKWPVLIGIAILVLTWIAQMSWLLAALEVTTLFFAALFYLRKSGNRHNLRKPLILLRQVMRA